MIELVMMWVTVMIAALAFAASLVGLSSAVVGLDRLVRRARTGAQPRALGAEPSLWT